MTTLIHSYCSRHVLCVDHTKFENIGALKDYLIETKVKVEEGFVRASLLKRFFLFSLCSGWGTFMSFFSSIYLSLVTESINF